MDQYPLLRNLNPIEIQTFQQNRYPCFFLDCIEEALPGKYARGYKCFTYNEWFFPAHFEDEPNVPGFIQIETLTQAFLMTFLTIPENKGFKTAFLTSKATFKKKIVPGMRLDIYAELASFRRGIAIGRSTGTIQGNFACQVDLTVCIPDVLNKFIPQKS